MSESLELARAIYRTVPLYTPDRTRCDIDLSDNTNRFGAPPAALAKLREAAADALTRYPSLYSDRLKECIAAYLGVAPANVVVGNGSDDVLELVMRAFCEPGTAVVAPEPSFAMVPLLARMNGLQDINIPLTSELDIDADAMLAAGGAITYICTPNNPTGNVMSAARINAVLQQARGVVLIDEAYAEFAGSSWVPNVVASGNALVVRTLSKAFGLAGLRVGYAIGAPQLVAEVEKARGPYKVNAMAEQVAAVALTTDLAWVKEHVALAIENRNRLTDALRAMSLSPITSSANFVLVPTPKSATEIATKMRVSGVAVRPFNDLPVVGDSLRISVGPWDMMQTTIRVLEGALR